MPPLFFVTNRTLAQIHYLEHLKVRVWTTTRHVDEMHVQHIHLVVAHRIQVGSQHRHGQPVLAGVHHCRAKGKARERCCPTTKDGGKCTYTHQRWDSTQNYIWGGGMQKKDGNAWKFPKR